MRINTKLQNREQIRKYNNFKKNIANFEKMREKNNFLVFLVWIPLKNDPIVKIYAKF